MLPALPRSDRRAVGHLATNVVALALCVLLGGLQSLAAQYTSPDADAGAQREALDGTLAEGYSALQRDDYAAAVEAFRRAYAAAGDSLRAADALYWQAFALYRQGDLPSLRGARELLARLAYRHAQSAEANVEAAALAARIEAQLALHGDASAAARIEAKARELAAADQQAAQVAAELQSQEARLQEQMMLRESFLAGAESVAVAGDALREVAGLAALGLPPVGLRNASREQEDDLRMIALDALARMDAERALPILESVLARRDAESARLRERAIFVLAMHDSEAARMMIREAARSDPEPSVKGMAINSLVSDDSDEARELLAAVLRGSGPVAVKERAVVTLGLSGGERAGELLRDVVIDTTQERVLRLRAVQALAHARPKGHTTFLRELFPQLVEPELQEAVVMALGHSGEGTTRRWLRDVVSSPHASLTARERAFFWVGQDDDLSTDELIRLYETFPEGESRRQAIYVIAQRRDEVAMEFMLRLARAEGDPQLRRIAIFWLGDSPDPRALELFEQLLTE